MENPERIHFDLINNRRFYIVAGTLVGLAQVLFFAIYANDNGYLNLAFSKMSSFMKMILIDRILIEAFSIVIFLLLIQKFHQLFKFSIPVSLKNVIIYNLKCFPFVVLALFIFIPIGISLRFIWRAIFLDINIDYLDLMSNFKSIYLKSVLPFTVISYFCINFNLSLLKKNILGNDSFSNEETQIRKEPIIKKLEVNHETGKTFIDIEEILWIKKTDRTCEVKTNTNIYYVRKTLKELEATVKPFDFLKINRAVLANKASIYNYSFWEHDKFILRMADQDKTEFIVSRDRMRLLKTKIEME